MRPSYIHLKQRDYFIVDYKGSPQFSVKEQQLIFCVGCVCMGYGPHNLGPVAKTFGSLFGRKT